MSRRRLCVYFCSPHFRSSVSVDDVKRLTEIVADDGNSPFDLLLETDGGTTDATEGLVHMLREANRDFRVIVPSRAKSNGTAICLSADRIVMGITSELGPIEPLIGKLPASLAMTPTYKATKPIVYYSGLHAFQQSKKLANDLLRTGMMRRKAKQRAKTVRMLCTRTHFYSHGSVINHAEAKKLGLRVEFLPVGDPLWQRYRLLHAMYEVDSNLTGTAKFFEGSQRSLVFAEEEGENDETVGSGHNE